MLHFVFQHGFGFDKSIWKRIAPHFKQYSTEFLDDGYFGNSVRMSTLNSQNINIGIGHSVGFCKLLQHEFDVLIGVNSFVDFCGNSRLRMQELNTMKAHFLKNPDVCLANFYERCNVSQPTRSPKIDLLLSDFELLKRQFKLPNNVPTLILASSNDVVLPREIVEKNFRDSPQTKLDFFSHAGHMLAIDEAEEIHTKIMQFVNDTKNSLKV